MDEITVSFNDDQLMLRIIRSMGRISPELDNVLKNAPKEEIDNLLSVWANASLSDICFDGNVNIKDSNLLLD